MVGLPLRIAFWSVPSVMAVVLVMSLCVCTRAGDDGGNRERGGRGRSSAAAAAAHQGEDYSEETGYVYRAPQYPTAPPYNPDFGQNVSIGHSYHQAAVAEYSQPLIQPPPYHDVVGNRKR